MMNAPEIWQPVDSPFEFICDDCQQTRDGRRFVKSHPASAFRAIRTICGDCHAKMLERRRIERAGGIPPDMPRKRNV